ncbi:MAG: type VI secretion system protein TssA [Opitutaceae bacterium]|jgi:type VI secretion system protein ImpA|nr:type VI secretion system protein TssA [Opitutaceae bacterium]
MSIDLSRFLEPVPGDDPAGEDLAATGALFELDRMILGKPETQFSQAEEADWRAVRERCEELLGQSRDLRVATALAVALLKTKGFPGFAAGLSLVRDMLATYWETLWPKLDPEDGNDPQERVNGLNNLAAPIGTAGDPYKTLETLRKTPVTQSREAGAWGLDAILAARDGAPLLDGSAAPSTALIDGAFSDSPPEFLAETSAAIDSALESAQALIAWFTDTLSASTWPTFEPLIADLKKLKTALDSHTGAEGGAGESGAAQAETREDGGALSAADASAARRAPAGIATREDVVRTIDLIIAYYSRNEPSSPIPLILERVKRLVPMNFMDIIKDMTPDAMDRVTLITGAKPPEEF